MCVEIMFLDVFSILRNWNPSKICKSILEHLILRICMIYIDRTLFKL